MSVLSRRAGALVLSFVLLFVAGCGGEAGGLGAPAGAPQVGRTLQPPAPPEIGVVDREYRPGAVLVKFRTADLVRSRESVERATGLRLSRLRSFATPGVHLMGLDESQDVRSVCDRLEQVPEVEYAEPDYLHRAEEVVPTDPRFAELWGLRNTGQSSGLAGADIEATLAWDTTTGSSSVIVGVIDTGVDYDHPDLAANMWRNPGETAANGIDDDGNGYVDDVYGINAVDGSGNPDDDHYHGTHVAGTIAARMGNGVGVVGVAPNVRIMALKFLDSGGRGYTSDAIACVDYAVAKGAHLTSNSWGGGGYSQALRDSIARAAAAGQLFVAAAGNDGSDNDDYPHYPSDYDVANVVSVGSSTRSEQVSYFSNYGLTSVDLFAPGSEILSTSPGGAYRSLSGTSMATPHVSGVAALLLSVTPGQGYAALKTRLLGTVDKLGPYSGMCTSGGRLNAARALSGSAPPSATLNSVTPSKVREGETVQLVGSGFGATQGTGRVSFLGAEASTVQSWSDTSIRVAVPVGAQTGSVSVQTGSGLRTNSVFLTIERQQAYGYQAASYQWREIATTGTPLWMFDNYSQEVSLGFSFSFYGATYSKVTVSSNGYLTFTGYGNMYPNQKLPTPNVVISDAICPFWDDLDPTKGGGLVIHKTLGTAPNREFVVTWLDMQHHDIPGDGTLQVILREGSNDILFQYQDVDFGNPSYDGGASASIGVANTGQTQGTQYPNLVAAGTALLFYAQNGGPPPEPPASPPPGTVRLDAVSPSNPRVGETVVLHGAAFGASQGAGYVSFPGAPRVTTVQSWADNRIEVKVPPSAGEGPTTVVNAGGDRSNAHALTTDRSTLYAWEDATYDWRDISTGTSLAMNDNTLLSVPLAFPFQFFDRSFGSIYVTSNGYLTFELSAAVYPNQKIPYAFFPDDLICAFWDDLNPAAGGSVRHAIRGTAPNREFIVSWLDVPHNQGTSPGTLQAILKEGSNEILFQYQDVDFGTPELNGGASASIGVEDETGHVGTQRPGLVANGTAVRFYPIPIDGGSTGTIPLTPGWNMVTFPVGRLDSLVMGTNLHPQLYNFDGQSYVPVDSRTASINARGPGQAFWVQSTGAGQLDYAGLKTDQSVSSVRLVPGWNLIGIPAESALPVSGMVVTPDATGTPVPLASCVNSQIPLPTGSYLYRYGFRFENGAYTQVDLSNPSLNLEPGQGMWVFVSEAAQLRFW